MGNYFMQRDDIEEAVMKIKNKLAELGSTDKTKNLVTSLLSFIQGKQSRSWESLVPHQHWSTFLKDLGQDQVLLIIRSGNTSRAWLSGVAYLTLFREIEEQENKYRAQGCLGVWGLADSKYRASSQVAHFQEFGGSLC